MFNHASQPTKNYTYGAKAPIENAQLVRDTIYKAHKYRNKLVELELARRENTEGALRLMVPALLTQATRLKELNEQIDKLIADLRAKRQKIRKRIKDPAIQQQLKTLKLERKELYAVHRALRKETFERADVKAALKAVEISWQEQQKNARKEAGIYWGTYLAIEQAASSFRQGAPPQYRGFRGDGRCVVQIQNGMTYEQLCDCEDMRLRLDVNPVPVPPKRASGRPCAWPQLYVRVGSDKKREPIWAVLPVKMHRPPPADALIKWVFINRRMQAGQEVYTVTFSLARAAGWHNPDTAKTGEVGIDLGWRLRPETATRPEGLRVAYFVGRDGQKDELVLPKSRLAMIDKADSIRGYRQVAMDALKGELLALRQSDAARPDWWQAATDRMFQWKSFGRLVVLSRHWNEQAATWPEQDALRLKLDAWRKRDSHLWRYETGLRTGFQNWRANLYREFACWLRRTYALVHLEDFNLKKLAKTESAEAEVQMTSDMRETMRRAAVGLLRRCITETVGSVNIRDAAYTTLACHGCGTRGTIDPLNLIVRCQNPQCSLYQVGIDQDYRAAMNLLNGLKDPPKDSKDPPESKVA